MLQTTKEFTRHMLYRLGWRRSHPHLRAEDRASRFSAIYNDGVWQRGNSSVPGSGEGSTIEATSEIRMELPAMLEKLRATTLLDVGCGDFTWMREVPLACDYIGFDIVPSVIAANSAQYADARHRFQVGDAAVDALPNADVILCREVLFHLSLADGLQALRNMMSSPSRRYLVTTTDRGTGFNSDIETGDFRMLNLERKPFGFPQPDAELRDDMIHPDRRLAVWNADAVRAALAL